MNQPDIKQSEVELRNIDELSNWEDNPRTVLKEDFERLKKQIKKLGLYRPLLVNQDNIVLGGNTTLRALRELNHNGDVFVTVVQADTPELMLEYALSANDQVGVTDDLKLAEYFQLHPIDIELYKVQSNVLRPLKNIINPPDHTTLGGDDGTDRNTIDESLERYLGGNIKQIVLYYTNEEYQPVVDQLTVLGKEMDLKNHTEVITRLIKEAHEGVATQA